MKKISNKIIAVAAAGALAIQNASAQVQDFTAMMTKANGELRNAGTSIINFASLLIGLVAIVMLIWNFIKRSKNDASSNDALVGWGFGLLFAALGLQVVKIVFLT